MRQTAALILKAFVVCILTLSVCGCKITNQETSEPDIDFRDLLNSEKTEIEIYRIQFISNQPKLVKVGKGVMNVKETEGKIRIEGGEGLEEIGWLEIDLKTGELTTSLGPVGLPQRVKAKKDMSLTGPWEGYSWRVMEISLSRGGFIEQRFYLGRLTEERKGIINYRYKFKGSIYDKVFKYDLQ